MNGHASVAGKVFVITGATSGIGFETAQRLAEMGGRLALVGRDQARGRAAREAIRRRVPGADIEIFRADLSAHAEVRRVAGELTAALPRIDVLINNAGAIFPDRQTTVDGLERTFALNHMAYFLLTALLRERLVASAPARVVVVASEAHRGIALDFADLQSQRHYGGWRAYRRSKLANILFTRELSRRLDGSDVVANCLHPGFVASRFGDDSRGVFRWGVGIAKRLFAISAEEGARTSIHVASATTIGSGEYYVRGAPMAPAPAARDDAAARRLWDVSANIVGMPANW